jgi:hypothetical protein
MNFRPLSIIGLLISNEQVFFFGNTQIQALLALLLVVMYVVMHVFAKVCVLLLFVLEVTRLLVDLG